MKRQNVNPPGVQCILNTVLNPNTTAIQLSIGSWNTDVFNVNNFLNQAANPATGLLNNPTDLAAQATSALANAMDEPCQLMTLGSISTLQDVPAFTCAVKDLMNVFMIHVINNLQNIIKTPTDTAAVTSAIDDINSFRCCNVLGDASILWLDAAEEAGIANQVTTTAPFENACAQITCTNVCSQMDNANFGTPGDSSSCSVCSTRSICSACAPSSIEKRSHCGDSLRAFHAELAFTMHFD